MVSNKKDSTDKGKKVVVCKENRKKTAVSTEKRKKVVASTNEGKNASSSTKKRKLPVNRADYQHDIEESGPRPWKRKNRGYRANFVSLASLFENYKITPEVQDELKRTPFYFLLEPIMSGVVKKSDLEKHDNIIMELLKTYSSEDNGFKVGGKVLRFTRNDIQLCLGIVCDKDVMDVKSTKSKPSDMFFKRHFEHSVKHIEGPAIGRALDVATNKTPSSKENNEDIARLICCYILAYALIPSTSNYISWGWAKYVVDMSSMKQYDWASALTNHFYGCLRSMNQVSKCNGGVVNLIPYFFLEHINLSPPSKNGVFPRYIKWNMQEMFHKLAMTNFENVDGAKVFEGELNLTILEKGIFSGGDNVDGMDSENEDLGRDEEFDGNCTQRGSDDGREQSVAEELVGSDEVSPQFLSTDSSDALLDELKDIIHKSIGVDGLSQELDKETASQQVDRAMAIVNDLSDQVKKLQADMQILEKQRKKDAKQMIAMQETIDLLYSTKLSSNSPQPLKLAGNNKNNLPHKAATLKCKEPENVVTTKKRKLVKGTGDDAKPVFKRTTRSSTQSDAAVATAARDNALSDLKSKLVLKKQKTGENSLVKQVKARTTREERVAKRRGSFLYDGENARGKSKKTKTSVKNAEKGRQDNCEGKNDEMPSFSLQMGLTQGSPVKQQKEAAKNPVK